MASYETQATSQEVFIVEAGQITTQLSVFDQYGEIPLVANQRLYTILTKDFPTPEACVTSAFRMIDLVIYLVTDEAEAPVLEQQFRLPCSPFVQSGATWDSPWERSGVLVALGEENMMHLATAALKSEWKLNVWGEETLGEVYRPVFLALYRFVPGFARAFQGYLWSSVY